MWTWMLFNIVFKHVKYVIVKCNKVSISSTYLHVAFTCTDPKSVQIHSSSHYLFALLRSALIKAAPKMLMKLTQGYKNMH